MSTNQEVICIDGKFSPEIIAFYQLHGVTWPIENNIYTFRDIITHTNGDIGILLQELVNPEVPIKHPILGVIYREPTWAIRRFTTLSGKPLEEYLKETKLETINLFYANNLL